MNNKWKRILVLGVALSGLMACGDDKGSDPEEESSSSGTSSTSLSSEGTSSVATSATSSATSSTAVSATSSATVSSTSSDTLACASDTLTGTYVDDIRLCSDVTYTLSGYAMMDSGATISIDAGTTIASSGKSALIIMPTAKIYAVGTASAPIIFTSSNATPAVGDWAGVVIFGQAPVSTSDGTQGFEADASLVYGGDVSDDSSGVMKYVRVEYAGWTVATDKELNGITFGGVGSKTDVSYIQVHAGEDDAFEFFGGTNSINHTVVTAYEDDGWDIDCGWHGTNTYGINIQGTNSDRAIEAGKVAEDENLITKGEFDYITIVKNSTNQALHIKDNVGLVLNNAVIVGIGDSAKEVVRVEGSVSREQLSLDSTSFSNVFYQGFSKSAVVLSGDTASIDTSYDTTVSDTDTTIDTTYSVTYVEDTTLEGYLNEGMTEGTDLLNDDLSPKSSAVSSAGAGAITSSSDLWYDGWTKSGTVSLNP
ncbi:MAG TPA: hypothetical protein VLM37_10930 [Fibrobacteraceae bacterium]|nr:hypothetical protein [Fibrobacteraceae bacterium]